MQKNKKQLKKVTQQTSFDMFGYPASSDIHYFALILWYKCYAMHISVRLTRMQI